jgi:hypothetical protein
MIFDRNVASAGGMRDAIHIVLKCPDICFLCNIHVIADCEHAASSIQQYPLIDHHAITD